MMNSFRLNPGVIFLETSAGENIPIGGVEEMTLPELQFSIEPQIDPLMVADHPEITINLKVSKKQMERFVMKALGITAAALGLIRGAGHTRVYHLAKYGRTARIRKRNVRRAFRILERGADHDSC